MFRLSITRAALSLLALAGLLAIASAAPAAPKESPKDSGIASGLVIAKTDALLTIQQDGDEDVTKYTLAGGLDKRSMDALKGIFDVDRVNIKYKLDGDTRKVVAIEKVVGKQTGVIVGEVVKVYNDFWVAVKPKNGMIEGFALNGPAEKVKAAADVLKSLKPGDTVTIKYGTDFERHRILQIAAKPAASK